MGTQGRRFDAFRLAGSRGTLQGDVDPSALPRLTDRVAGDGGRIGWTIAGSADGEGRPALTVRIAGSVPLTCQRCLGALELEIEQSTRLLLAHDDAELRRLDESSEDEVVLADGALDPLDLVEDELLLTLPFAPRHPSECSAEGVAG